MHPPAGFPLPLSIDEKTFFTPESYVPQSESVCAVPSRTRLDFNPLDPFPFLDVGDGGR